MTTIKRINENALVCIMEINGCYHLCRLCANNTLDKTFINLGYIIANRSENRTLREKLIQCEVDDNERPILTNGVCVSVVCVGTKERAERCINYVDAGYDYDIDGVLLLKEECLSDYIHFIGVENEYGDNNDNWVWEDIEDKVFEMLSLLPQK